MRKPTESVGNLTGNYLVRRTGPACHEVGKLWPDAKDWSKVRRHALKLRYFPEQRPVDDAGTVLDLDWSWIRSLRNKRVGELRIHDTIGGHDNIRLIFLVGGRTNMTPLPVIWILSAIQKKRTDFSTHLIDVFDSRRTLVQKRFYFE